MCECSERVCVFATSVCVCVCVCTGVYLENDSSSSDIEWPSSGELALQNYLKDL